DRFDAVLVQGVDESLCTKHARITAWMDNGTREVYRLRLRNGTSIRATANHEFLTEDGWRRLDELTAGDFVATPRELALAGGGRRLESRERARVRLLAYLLGDGSLSHAQPSFFSADPALIADFRDACT